MKYYTLSFITIIFLVSGCQKIINNNSAVSKIKTTSLLDSISSCKWVFTEYHDKVTFPDKTNIMCIISDGNEIAKVDNNGMLYLNRDCAFSFAAIDFFNTNLQPASFVNSTYSEPYYDTVNFSLINKSVVLSRSIKWLPDTMSILNIDTACLVLKGILHVNNYDVNRTIIFYKNTRYYGGYRNYSGL